MNIKKSTRKSQILKQASVLMLTALSASAAIRYVNVNSASPSSPYTNWTTAATTIQDAVDSAVAGDQILVTNGVYETGGRMVDGTTNRVAVNQPLTVQSVNGAAVTLIQGDHVMRCVYLTNGAALAGFALINGHADTGGGVWCEPASAVVSNCTFNGNSADYQGGGAFRGTLNNCTLTGNSADFDGGGAEGGRLNNCTLTGNSAGREGGGVRDCTLNNCIVYYNRAQNGDNYTYFNYNTFSFSCTTPLPPGLGNTSAEPQLADLSHLSAGSPCHGAGSAASANGLDIDGETWADPPSIGCDEYHPRAVTGPLSVSAQAACTNVALGFRVSFTAAIIGHATANRWDFGDGIVVSNQPYASHSWAVAGDYSVELRAYNNTYPSGVSATIAVHVVAQPVHYVAVRSLNSMAPYTSWATAATNIQDAVDAASVAGALVLVTNGVYQTGERVVSGAGGPNRVAVTKALKVQSVNGAAVTVIQGSRDPDPTDDDYIASGRCVYLANGAALVGFTLTNGASGFGAGVWCESASAVLSNCVLAGNSVGIDGSGGGAYGGTLNNCTLTGNSAVYGGAGGGAVGGTLNHCTLTANSATYGGGTVDSTLYNCTLTGNSADYGAGGAWGGTLNNCTLNRNAAGYLAGGVAGSKLNNCIVYYNSARFGANYSEETLFSYSCTTPLPPEGVGNISAEPLLSDLSHLSAGSPCRGAGSTAYATGLDIDGEAWTNPPSIGCDEYHSGAITGPLTASIQADFTNVTVGFGVNLAAVIEGHASANQWEFGDGTRVSNQLFALHRWSNPGDYLVVLRASNDTYPGGVDATVTVHVAAQPVHFVATQSANPVAPYTSWATAANELQDAVNAASVAGALILVTNGVYLTGGTMVVGTMSRVAVNKPLTIQSVNGAAATLIQGDQGTRCVYLTNGATLVGFTLTNGVAENGGGVWCESGSEVVSNCVLTGNRANRDGGAAFGGTLNNCTIVSNSAFDFGGGTADSTLINCMLNRNSASGGGGAFHGALNNCVVTSNTAVGGGGVYYATLNNCTVSDNSATRDGGGVSGSTLNNCIVYFNNAPDAANYVYCSLNYSCVTPLPADGTVNITNVPLFLNQAGGNLRLQSNSPCINAGINTAAPAGPDLDGNPRIAGGTVDVGAYEFQSPQARLSYAWLQQYGLPTDGSADNSDADGDGLNNWQEWRADTNPTNALSALRLLNPASGAPGVILSWQSVSGRNYFIERNTELGAQPLFIPLASNIVGQPGTTTFTDTNAVAVGPFFYRVGVQE